MKFLFISPRFSGGIGGHAAMLSDQLSKKGHEVTKMKTPHIPIKNLKNPSFAVFGIVKGILNTKQYDIVHAFNIPSAFAMRFVKAKKKVLSVHGVFSDQVTALHSTSTSSMANIAESKTLKWADKLTTDSQKTKEKYLKKLGVNFEYLPSPIDPQMFDNIPNFAKNESQIAYIGRDSYEKGIDILKNIEPKIHGKVVYCVNAPWKEAMSTLKSSSILVVPSRMESLPTVIKEAFFLKIPVVAFSVGGIPELIENNKTGLLVESGNSELLLKTINQLLSDPSLQSKLSSNALIDVKNRFTWDVIIPKYIKFYEELLSEK